MLTGLTCCTTTNESRVTGVWHAEASCVDVWLEVLPDHTFVQTVRTKQGEANQLTGTWSFDPYWINFNPFLDLIEDTRGKRVGGFGSPVEWIGVLHMGPVIIKCPDSSHEADYTK